MSKQQYYTFSNVFELATKTKPYEKGRPHPGANRPCAEETPVFPVTRTVRSPTATRGAFGRRTC